MASIVIVDGLDLASIRLFLAVVELGSVSKAAERHGMSQPSATARLHKLERQLGVALLDRSPTGSHATSAGRRLAASCTDLLASGTALVDRADQLRDEESHLAIAATRHVVDSFLAEWITGADLDGVSLDVIESDTLRVAQAVRGGDAVLGFTDGPMAPVGLRSEIVATEDLLPVVGRTHAWFRRRRPLPADALGSTVLIWQRSGSGTRDVVDAALTAAEVATTGEQLEVPSATTARLAALTGAGVAFLPESRVARDIDRGLLSVVPVLGGRVEQPVRVVWRGARPSVRSAQRLLDAIASA